MATTLNFRNNRKEIIYKSVLDKINEDINEIILNIDLCFKNDYVSSNRFVSRRTYSHNDDSDFTNTLKKILNNKKELSDTKNFKIISNYYKIEPRRLKYDFLDTLLPTSKITESNTDDYSIFYKLNDNNIDFDELNSTNKFILKWLKKFEIADELILKSDKDTINYKAYLKKDNKEIILADYGLGTNQLLPIIFSLAIGNSSSPSRTVVIEEPEANLHPAMQSKLAELFVDAIKTFGVKIIAETHSEYLIRKMQYLIASEICKLKPDEFVVYYFSKPNHPDVLTGKIEQIRKIETDEYGKLNKELGPGFFDETNNIIMDLFFVQQVKKK